MKFAMNPGPYFRNKRSTTQIMFELLIGLAVIWLCSIIYYFTTSTSNGIQALLNPIICVITALITETLFMLPKHISNKNSIKDLFTKLLNSYGYVTGFILALTLPVGTSIYVSIISTIFAIAVGKMCFGGFGHNIFNPAIVGRIFAQTAFLSSMQYDTSITTGATIGSAMGQYDWALDIVNNGDINLLDILLGNYRGALGETFTLVIILVGAVLIFRKVIDWRIPVTYLLTVFLCSFFMGITGGYGLDSFEFGLVHISIGGVMFAAIFCLTDPVSSPTSMAGKIIFASGAGLLTCIIRYFASAPEGSAYSILIMNMLTPLIDSSIKGLSNQHLKSKIITVSVLTALTITSGCIAGTTVDKTQYINYLNNSSKDSKALTSTVKRVSELENGNEIYNVVVKGNLQHNFSKNCGDVRKVFKDQLSEYDIYFNNSYYQNVSYFVDGSSLFIKYKEELEKYEENVLTLSTGLDENDNWVIKNSYDDYVVSTGYTREDYKSIYSISLDEEFNIIVTFVSDHTKRDETNVSYSSVDFDVELNYKDRLIIKTTLNSTGAGGGVGDAMLDGSFNFNIGDYTITEENAEKAKDFYHQYIEISSPVSFDKYLNVSNGSLNISDADTSLKVGATYTANGYMFAIQSVILYADAYHAASNIGKVGV